MADGLFLYPIDQRCTIPLLVRSFQMSLSSLARGLVSCQSVRGGGQSFSPLSRAISPFPSSSCSLPSLGPSRGGCLCGRLVLRLGWQTGGRAGIASLAAASVEMNLLPPPPELLSFLPFRLRHPTPALSSSTSIFSLSPSLCYLNVVRI